jgi:hypothetical protein
MATARAARPSCGCRRPGMLFGKRSGTTVRHSGMFLAGIQTRTAVGLRCGWIPAKGVPEWRSREFSDSLLGPAVAGIDILTNTTLVKAKKFRFHDGLRDVLMLRYLSTSGEVRSP